MTRLLLSLAVVATLSTHLVRAADEPAAAPKVGDPAPKFSAETDGGQAFKSADVIGKKIVVVYFYPADMTGGCTAQACGFRDAIAGAKFDSDEVEIIGVSGDSAENHKQFKAEHDLNFTLLADPEGKIARAFGVKTAPGGTIAATFKDGKTADLTRGTTTMRTTFVIDRDGKIADKADISDAKGDPERVVKVIERLEK